MRGPNVLIKIVAAAIISVSLWGCGKANDNAPAVDISGKHPATWILNHGASYLANAKPCGECHAADLMGGIAQVSCFSINRGAQSCHSNGPHPFLWPEHNMAPNQGNACAPCHGANLAGSAKAPACSKCHVSLTPGASPILGTCISCHATPPTGAVFPNISGAHGNHAGACNSCHNGGGTGKANHGRQLTVAFLTPYNAKTGTGIFNPDNSCSNISCHGGVRTPIWRGGKINVNSDCVFCHEPGTALQTPQFNSYYSGKHTFHTAPSPNGAVGLVCTDCHDMTVTNGGASHFSSLNTPMVFELNPQLTIRAAVGYSKSGTTATCSPIPGSFSITVCHGQRNW